MLMTSKMMSMRESDEKNALRPSMNPALHYPCGFKYKALYLLYWLSPKAQKKGRLRLVAYIAVRT